MFTFWILIIVMTLIAMGFIFAPLYATSLNVRWTGRISRKAMLGILIGFAVLSVGLYAWIGNASGLSVYLNQAKNNALVSAEMKQFHTPQELIPLLKAHLEKNPTSAKGWFLLGQLYFSASDPKNAMSAFQKAYTLKPQDLNYALSYAQITFIQNHEQLTPEAQKIVSLILKKQPNNVSAMSLIALNAYHAKNYPAAIAEWEQMLSFYPQGSPESDALLKTIAEAQKQNSE